MIEHMEQDAAEHMEQDAAEHMEQDAAAVVHPKDVDAGSMRFRMWCLGPFETIQQQPTFPTSQGE